jgi:hypothetical protein
VITPSERCEADYRAMLARFRSLSHLTIEVRRAKAEFGRLFAETPSAFAARLAAYLARPVTKPPAGEDEPVAAQAAVVTPRA